MGVMFEFIIESSILIVMMIEVAKLSGQKKLLYSVTGMSREGRNLEKRIRAISERKIIASEVNL